MKHSSKTLLSSVLLSACTLAATAQTASDYLRAADKFFREGDYYSASQYYEKYLTGKPGKQKSAYNPYVVQKAAKSALAAGPASSGSRKEVVYQLAESYRLINYFSKAEPYYREAAQLGPVNPLAPYWHAKCQRAIGNLDSAELEFRAFQASYGTQDEVAKDVQKELDNLAFVKTQRSRKDLGRYIVGKSSQPLNAGGASYAPFYLGDGSLTFTSTRLEGDSNLAVGGKDQGKNPYTNKLYSAATGSTIAAGVEKISVPTDKQREQGVAAYTPDGSRLYLTRWEMKGKQKVASLYSSRKGSDGSWSTPEKLPLMINAEGSSTQQPFVTADGRYLLFASDRSGGQGKMDLYIVALSSSGEPSAEVRNLGSTVNTAGDDEAPFYHQPSATLVYASNGRVGMGGYDLYYSKGSLEGSGSWEVVQNMGQPVNSVKDDIYYASNDKVNIWNNALFSSDRDSPCCLELYTFNRRNLPKVVLGSVVDCEGNKPLAGASVSIRDASGKTVATKTTNERGEYSLTLAEYEALKVEATNRGYNSNALNVAAPDTEEDTYTNPVLCLTAIPAKPIEENTAVVLRDVLFGFNRSELVKRSAAALDTVVALMNQYPSMEIELSSHTDNVGSDEYNQRLSEKRAESCVAYLVKKGIDKARIQSKGYGETQPVAPNEVDGKDNPAGRERNRRTEFKILHY